MTSDEIAGFVDPVRVYSCEDVLTRPSPVPAQDGVYGWWFRKLPPLVMADGCRQHQGLRLLYAGISPNRPPRNGRSPSRQTLRDRIKYHYTGNAEGSTLRKTLGCLLADDLGIELRRVGLPAILEIPRCRSLKFPSWLSAQRAGVGEVSGCRAW